MFCCLVEPVPLPVRAGGRVGEVAGREGGRGMEGVLRGASPRDRRRVRDALRDRVHIPSHDVSSTQICLEKIHYNTGTISRLSNHLIFAVTVNCLSIFMCQ